MAARVHIAFLIDLPDSGQRQVLGAAGTKALDEVGAGRVIIAEQLQMRGSRRDAFDIAIDLAAGRRLFVDDDGAQSRARRSRCGGEAGWTGTDDGEIEMAAHRSTSALPCWRSMRMPSTTGTRHDCWFGAPSISTRHSKHTPIMQ